MGPLAALGQVPGARLVCSPHRQAHSAARMRGAAAVDMPCTSCEGLGRKHEPGPPSIFSSPMMTPMVAAAALVHAGEPQAVRAARTAQPRPMLAYARVLPPARCCGGVHLAQTGFESTKEKTLSAAEGPPRQGIAQRAYVHVATP